jgi:hypothetical protein
MVQRLILDISLWMSTSFLEWNIAHVLGDLYLCVSLGQEGLYWFFFDITPMMVSHEELVAVQNWKENNLLTWRDSSRYFYNEFKYGVRG